MNNVSPWYNRNGWLGVKKTTITYLPIRWIMFRPDITETLKTERWKNNYLPTCTYTYLTFHRHTQSETILSEEEERIRGFQVTEKNNTCYLPIRWNMFRPDITETVDWVLKKQLPSYLYLYLSHLSSPHAIRNNPVRGRRTHPRFSSDRKKQYLLPTY